MESLAVGWEVIWTRLTRAGTCKDDKVEGSGVGRESAREPSTLQSKSLRS